MNAIRSELEGYGLVFPNMQNSNMEVTKEIAEGSGRLIGKHKQRTLFMLIDGLGYDLLIRAISRSTFLKKVFSDAEVKKISTIFPSYTPTVITSIDSGLTPAEHGLVGGHISIKEQGRQVNIFSIPWKFSESAQKDPYSARPMFPILHIVKKMSRYKGFTYLQPEQVIQKEFEPLGKEGIRFVPYISLDDMIIQILELIENQRATLLYAYLDYIDHASHTYGNKTSHGLEIIVYALERIVEKLLPIMEKHGWRLIITSDHGQITTSSKYRIDVLPKDNIMKHLRFPPQISAGVAFFDVVGKGEKEFEDAFHKKLGKDFLLYNSDEAIMSGMFGKKSADPWIRYRFGTHVAISKGKYSVNYCYPNPKKIKSMHPGIHGGMSKDEMEIPLVIL